MKHHALITGGAGFIGSNVAERLLQEGWRVTILDNLSRFGVKKNLAYLEKTYSRKQLHVVTADIREYQKVKRAVAAADVVYHLAGQVAVTTSFRYPREDFEINALGTLNVLEAARQSRHRSIVVYASTNKVYGNMESVPVQESKTRYGYGKGVIGIDESFPLDFHSPYGCSKGVGDQYVRDYFRMYNIPTLVFRQSCIYGPRQMGVEDQGWVAHLAARAVLDQPITVYGDGKQVRDLLHVSDLVDAYQLAVHNIKKTQGQVYNVGGGADHSFSLVEYIAFLEKLLGKKLIVRQKDWRLGDQKVYISDNRKAEQELAWRIKHCHTDGLAQLVDWVVANKKIFAANLAKPKREKRHVSFSHALSLPSAVRGIA